jgi:hypothetical protein
VPFGPLYAIEFVRQYGNDVGQYIRRINKRTAWLARYGRQDMAVIENTPTVTVLGWIEALDEILDEERQAAENARKK